MKEPVVGVERGKSAVASQQHELNGTLSLSFKYATDNNRICSIFTATILEWKRLLKPDKYEDVLSFAVFAKNERARYWC